MDFYVNFNLCVVFTDSVIINCNVQSAVFTQRKTVILLSFEGFLLHILHVLFLLFFFLLTFYHII